MIINRYYGKKQVIGDLIYKDLQLFTLELPNLGNQRRISCIPEGVYTVVKHTAPKFGECFWIKDVPGRSEILIHTGNYAGSKNSATKLPDLLGCIAPGLALKDINKDGIIDVTSSGLAMKLLLDTMPNEFKLTIQ